MLRDGPGLPLRMRSEDIIVHRTRNSPKCATAVLLDMSGSMRYDGLYINVKRMGLALDGLIRREYPGDWLRFIEVYTFAKLRQAGEVVTLMPKPVTVFDPVVRLKADMSDERISEMQIPPHFTNIQHGLQLARQLLAGQDTPNRQVILITDGLPTAHFEGKDLYLLYPPDARTEEATLREGQLCRREGITINIFLLQSWWQSSEDVQFAQKLSESTTGRVFFTAGKDLDRYVVWDYVKRRREIVVNGPRPVGLPAGRTPKFAQISLYTVDHDRNCPARRRFRIAHRRFSRHSGRNRAAMVRAGLQGPRRFDGPIDLAGRHHGSLLGGVLSLTNLYIGLKAGWGFGVAITACILSYAIWSGLFKIGLAKTQMTILENNCMQSTASSAGYSTGGTLISAFAAYIMLNHHGLPIWLMLCWVFFLAVLGVTMAIPMKRQMINIEQLRFPSGIAAAETLRVLHSHGERATRSARALGIACVAGGDQPVLDTRVIRGSIIRRVAGGLFDSSAVDRLNKAVLGNAWMNRTVCFDWDPIFSPRGR